MATYAIGDIHGCFATFRALLERVRFDEKRDRLWLVGDVVNRGPASLQVLQWLVRFWQRRGDDGLVVVLGNHDLHLLSRWAGLSGKKKRDTLEKTLASPEAPELLDWLRRRPLLHREGEWVMVHAGLHPAWSIAAASKLAREVGEELGGESWRRTLAGYKDTSRPPWSDDLPQADRRGKALEIFTLLRTLRKSGEMDRDFAGVPQDTPKGRTPWFAAPARWRDEAVTVLFGHWAALGVHFLPGGASDADDGGDELGEDAAWAGVICLDSGAAWEGRLTAFRLEDGALFQEPNRDMGPWKAKA